jgi:hypothetical protein
MTGGQSAVRMNDRHSFPAGGLVELSRATYQSTPLAVVETRPTVFSFLRHYWRAHVRNSEGLSLRQRLQQRTDVEDSEVIERRGDLQSCRSIK